MLGGRLLGDGAVTAHRITFGGLIPKLTPLQLPDASSRVAANVSLLSGELVPMRKSVPLWSPFAASALLSFYRIDGSNWFGWPQEFVQMEAVPVEGASRYAYTGDGVPKITTVALGTPAGASGLPAASRALGIPVPQAAPTLSSAGGAGATVTRYYAYTFMSDWIEESSPSPISSQVSGKVDGTWSIGGMDTAPPNTGSVTAATHSGGVVTITLGTANHYLRAGEQTTIASVVGMTSLNGVWTIASVPLPNKITVALTTAQTYTSGGTWTRVNPWGTCTKRLYRTAGTSADYQLVAEGISGATYSDTLTDAQILGDSLVSEGWEPPPTTLVGLVALTNGVMAGFLPGSKTVYLSEPYQPHAWPTRYRKKMQDVVVGLAAYDATLVVATVGSPVVFAGMDPDQMTPTRHVKPLPALSRGSVCSVSDGVVYASKIGLVRVDLAGAQIITESLFTPEGWDALEPATMLCAFDGQRLLISTKVNQQAYMLDAGSAMVSTSQAMSAVRSDPATGDLYFANGKIVYRFDSFDAAPMTLDYWSKDFRLAKPENMGAAKVELSADYTADAASRFAFEHETAVIANAALLALPAGGCGGLNTRPYNAGPWNGSILLDAPEATGQVSFIFYANGKMVFSKNVPSGQSFALPGGYKADTFSVRVQANTQVRSIVVADTLKNMAEV